MSCDETAQPEGPKMETADICVELEKMAKSGVLPQRTCDACTQAALLLKGLREVILAPELPEAIALKKLKWILVEQGEG